VKLSLLLCRTLRAAGEASALIRKMSRRRFTIRFKGEIDPVTSIDEAVEEFLISRLKRITPGYAFLSEESGSEGKNEWTWVIDPLDGTVNFSHGFPVYSVSIALLRGKRPVLGVIADPSRNEYFHALRGRGAYLNNRRIAVSEIRDLKRSIFATGFPYDVWKKNRRVLSIFRKFLLRSQAIRRLGSAALDLCWVACGRLDGFWEEDLKAWDTMAGILIVEEAGGRVTQYDGKRYRPGSGTLVASNKILHPSMLEVTRSFAAQA